VAWGRFGDTSANHPTVLRVLEWKDCDDRLVNEVHGFALRCAAQSGAHLTDYVVTRGTAMQLAGFSRFGVVIEVAIFAGYMTKIDVDGEEHFKLVDDDPEFLHLRLKAEVEWERQRRTDNSNPSLIVPVRLRDGDGCRWCGKIVNWGSKTGARSGTYDHLYPGRPAEVDTYVVCCRGCNSSRKDGSHPRDIDQLLPAPTKPYYSPYTVNWLEGNEWRATNGIPVPPAPKTVISPGTQAPGTQPPAKSTPGSSPATPAASLATAGERTDSQSEGAPSSTAPAPRADSQSVNAPSKRPEHHSGNASYTSGTRDHQRNNGSCQDPDRKPQEPPRAEGTNPVSPGRVGSGRDGSVRFGGPAVPRSQREIPVGVDPPAQPTPARRRRRSRRHKTNTSSGASDV
jgi:hypothetical protein